MSYESIERIISAWAIKHALHVYTTYRDEEVRSVELVSPNGRKCQLWVDAPDQSGNIQVHVWDYKKRRIDRTSSAADLNSCLEQSYATAREWLS